MHPQSLQFLITLGTPLYPSSLYISKEEDLVLSSMAPNKFATILHKKTNRITLVLVYAVLEWVLIFLLLLNSLFSYLIIKFAHYFGLKPPCLLCSRLDHILEPHNSKSSYRELICEQHAIELSRSGYCFNHPKLVELRDMCEDCSSSHLHNHQHPSVVSVFRWLKEVGMVKSDDDCMVVENDDVNLRCSCCGVTINSYVLSPHPVMGPSSEVSEDAQKANRDGLLHPSDFDEEPDQNGKDTLGIEDEDRDGIDNCRDIQMGPDSDLINEDDNSDGFSFWLPEGGYSMVHADEEEEGAASKAHTKPALKVSTKGSYANERILPQHVEFYIDLDDYQLVPVKMVNLETKRSEDECQVNREEHQNHKDQEESTQLCRETNEGLVLEPVSPAALDFLKIDDLMIEDLPTEQGQEQELKREIHVEEELEDTEMKESSSKQGHEEEIKREAGDAVVLHENIVQMLPTVGGEAEATMREVKLQVVGDQTYDVPAIAVDDQLTEEMEFNELNVNIPTADNDETEFEELPTKQGQDMELKREIVVEVELEETRTKEVSSYKTDEEEIKIEVGDAVANRVEILPVIEGQEEATRREIDFQDAGDREHNAQLSAIDDQVPEETELKDDPTSDYGYVFHTEHDETKAEDLPVKQGQEMEIMELDDTKTKELPNKEGHEVEMREVDDAELVDTNKVEILPTIQGQTETKTGEIYFLVSEDQTHDVPITAFDDRVTEETELNQLNANIASSDFGDLCSTENIVKSLDSTDNGQMLEPSISCKEECPCSNLIIFQPSTSSSGLQENGDCEHKQTEETQNRNYTRVDISEQELLYDSARSLEPNEVEGDKCPHTLDSVDNLHHLHKEIPFLQGMGSSDQETLEGSVANELDNSDGVATLEELKCVLKSERNALRALYSELEEERNAAAVATNQTMLMISRLQEEKATVEMEALQYQRMMEEQSEYDQEALQLMNEILVKREKELQEVEKELEVCRKKVMDYEERERMRLLSQRKSRSYSKGRTSSASCSNGEESDGFESREEDSLCRCEENGHHEDTPVDAILNLEESLSSFEEERVSILEQLKVLEQKLCTLAEEDEHGSQNIAPFEQFKGDNAENVHTNCKDNGDSNGLENGSSAINGKHYEKWRMNGQKPMQLLPLFDAAELESDDELSIGIDGLDPIVMIPESPPTKFELENKRLAVEEEVDHMYDRLHALEADREFIKHCIGSLSKGGRGVHLLQQILQHLRDLKNVELQSRSLYSLS